VNPGLSLAAAALVVATLRSGRQNGCPPRRSLRRLFKEVRIIGFQRTKFRAGEIDISVVPFDEPGARFAIRAQSTFTAASLRITSLSAGETND